MKFSRSEISEKCLVQFGFFHFKFRSVLLDNFIKQKFLFSEEWQGWVVWSVSRLIFLTSVYPQRIRQFHSLNVITYQKLYCFITSFYRESMENLMVYYKVQKISIMWLKSVENSTSRHQWVLENFAINCRTNLVRRSRLFICWKKSNKKTTTTMTMGKVLKKSLQITWNERLALCYMMICLWSSNYRDNCFD